MIRVSGRHFRHVLFLITAAATVLVAPPATTAEADSPISGASLDCTITLTVDINPGITPHLGHVALTTHGFTGTADCSGTIDGASVTGTGVFALDSADTADCTLAAGHGEFVLQVPTLDGTTTVAGTVISVGTVLSGDLTAPECRSHRRRLRHHPPHQRDRGRHRPHRTLTTPRRTSSPEIPGDTMIRPPHPPTRRALLVASTAALLALPATVARADTDAPVSTADLDCTITVTTDVDPGVTPQLRHVAVTSHGLTGIADCTGTINGNSVTGPGTFAVTIQETANCTQLSGQGEFVLRVPTTDGTATVAGTFDVTGTSAGAVLTGDLTGIAHVTAVLEGDCLTTPLTRVTTQIVTHIGP